MSIKSPRALWENYSAATVGIAERFSRVSAIQYLVGEKLMLFAQLAEADPNFLAELPAFSAQIRALFTSSEITGHFDQADRESMIDADIMKGASADEIEEMGDVLDENRRDRERRSWVKSMLLRTGS